MKMNFRTFSGALLIGALPLSLVSFAEAAPAKKKTVAPAPAVTPSPVPSPTPSIEPEVAAPTAATEPPPVADDRNHDEDWYWGFNLGGGSIRYKSAAIQANIDANKAKPDTKPVTVYFDLYFLWPVSGHSTALGISLGGVSDNVKQDSTDSEVNLTTSLLGFSAHHYFMGNIGDGLFARADVGLASVKETDKLVGVKTESDTMSGFGARVGLGYSILLSNETRLPLTVQYQYASTKNTSGSNAVVFTGGLLF
jgi:hypothetical protein